MPPGFIDSLKLRPHLVVNPSRAECSLLQRAWPRHILLRSHASCGCFWWGQEAELKITCSSSRARQDVLRLAYPPTNNEAKYFGAGRAYVCVDLRWRAEDGEKVYRYYPSCRYAINSWLLFRSLSRNTTLHTRHCLTALNGKVLSAR